MDIGAAQYLDTSEELPMPEGFPAPPSPPKKQGSSSPPSQAPPDELQLSQQPTNDRQQRHHEGERERREGAAGGCGGALEGEGSDVGRRAHQRTGSGSVGPGGKVHSADQQQQQLKTMTTHSRNR